MNTYNKSLILLLGAVLAMGLLLSPVVVHAATYGFEAITDNSGNSNVWDNYFQLETAGTNSVSLTFTNNFAIGDPNAGTISEVYLYLATQSLYDALTNPTLSSSPGVSFSPGATPPNLPAYSGFKTYSFTYDANNPSPKNGVNPGEFLTISMDWAGSGTIDSLLADGSMAVGIHVQSLGPEGASESMIVHATPIPGAVFLLGGGLLGIVPFVRRKRT